MENEPKTAQTQGSAEPAEAITTPESRREQGRRSLNRQIAQRQKLLLVGVGAIALIGGATFLPLDMDPERAVFVFGLIFSMCAGAGLLAMRKLRDASPADMF